MRAQAASPHGAGSQSAEDADLEDALGEWDDAEEELYLARLSQWESRQHLLTAADVVPGQVSFHPNDRTSYSRQVDLLYHAAFADRRWTRMRFVHHPHRFSARFRQ